MFNIWEMVSRKIIHFEVCYNGPKHKLIVRYEVLNCSKVGMGSKGAIMFSDALRTNHSLTVLDISGNAIKDAGFNSLAAALKGNHRINRSIIQLYN